jgi:hypothetical protein
MIYIKLSIKSLHDKYILSPDQNQWDAITNHAKNQGVRITGFATIFTGKKNKRRD